MNVPVTFTATDDVKVSSWEIKDIWTPGGTTVSSGSASGSGQIQASVPVDEGGLYLLQAVAIDEQGNAGATPGPNGYLYLYAPWDDSNAGMNYSGTWSHTTGDSTWFMGTYHSSSTNGSSVTFTVPSPCSNCY